MTFGKPVDQMLKCVGLYEHKPANVPSLNAHLAAFDVACNALVHYLRPS